MADQRTSLGRNSEYSPRTPSPASSVSLQDVLQNGIEAGPAFELTQNLGQSSERRKLQQKGPSGDRGRNTVYGLRRPWFWTVLGAVGLIAVSVIVIGGLLGSRASEKKPIDNFEVLPGSYLAAVNYTSVDGVSYKRVYFQTKSTALYQAVWSSSSEDWQITPLNPLKVTEPNAKVNTPLAASVHFDEQHSTFEFHIFFLDNTNKIWERGTTNPVDMWGSQVQSTLLGNYTAANNSKLAVYSTECDNYCASTSVLCWQSLNNELWFSGFITNYGWWAHQIDLSTDSPVLSGSSLSISPMWTNESEILSLYANTGQLVRIDFNTTDKWEDGWSLNETFAGWIAPDAGITSFHGWYDGEINRMLDMEVLVTSHGGAAWDSGSPKDDIPEMSSLLNHSTIASTPGGTVYVLEGGQLIEWEWQHGNKTYVKTQVINLMALADAFD